MSYTVLRLCCWRCRADERVTVTSVVRVQISIELSELVLNNVKVTKKNKTNMAGVRCQGTQPKFNGYSVRHITNSIVIQSY